MKQEQNERAKRIELISLVVGVTIFSHFAGLIASILVFIHSSKARSLRSLTS